MNNILLLIGGEIQPRRVLFWFSWDANKLSRQFIPDVNFQLNPWTIYSIVYPNFEETLVRVPFLSLFGFSYFSTQGWCFFLSELV
jgi:hypothetical protein